jgi:hypothetical protein
MSDTPRTDWIAERNYNRQQVPADYARELERENARLNDLLNPRMWTLEMSTAWHKNIPDVHAAFAALRSLPNVQAEPDAQHPRR